jgi:hypothetical protein
VEAQARLVFPLTREGEAVVAQELVGLVLRVQGLLVAMVVTQTFRVPLMEIHWAVEVPRAEMNSLMATVQNLAGVVVQVEQSPPQAMQ